MTTQLLNRDVFERDPSTSSLENDGVSKVDNRTALRYELATFVCEGEYEKGLFRILDTYLGHLSQPTQPSAWVSGFYGSGKSHLVKILEALWTNTPFADSSKPRDIVRLPRDIDQQLRELSNQAKRGGGLWAAAGMLAESREQSVRTLILGIVYKAAGLSSDYGRARFRLWVRERGWEAEIIRRIEDANLDPDEEFDEYLISPIIADAVWELSATKSTDAGGAQERWHAHFNRTDITIDEMESALNEVLRLQSADGTTLPLTLIVLDEVQQYIAESGAHAQALQEAVERIQSAFESKVLVVATGQAALNETPNLQKLQGRFTVNVMLSDRDVEHVVREVVLRKAPTHKPRLETTIRQVEGEIDRHLPATSIGPRSEDKAILVPDYPLLPTRNRFWASLLHALDPTGTSGQLRTQLRVIHGATVHVADKPLGHVIPADFIYDQLHGGLQQTGALPRDVSNLINDQEDGTADGRLRARVIQLIFLIAQLPTGDLSDIGVKATPDNLADLLVEDLRHGGTSLRQRIPELLHGLEEEGKLMRASDGGYAIQTGESLKWQQHLRQERQALVANPGPLGEIRARTIDELVREQAKSPRRTHGASSTARTLAFRFGNDTPESAAAESSVVVWVRDGWTSAEATVVNDARAAGDESALIALFVPQQNAPEVQSALANYEAAKRTLDLRGASQDSPDGQKAADGVRIRLQENERRFRALLRDAVAAAAVYQGGGAEVEGATLADKLQTAFDSSLKRLFPNFADGDHPDWAKVYTRAVQGSPDALKAIGHQGDDAAHPVVREIRRRVPGGGGLSWSALRKTFENAPYGWPRDTIDGAVAVLVNAGAVNASRAGRELPAKDLSKQQANAIQLAGEDVVVSFTDALAARGLFVKLDGKQPTDDEVRAGARDLVERLIALARAAGGEPPVPLSVVPTYLTELRHQTGNQLIKSLAEHAAAIDAGIATWRDRAAAIAERLPAWTRVEQLAEQAHALPGYGDIAATLAAIRDNRQLLDSPDPVAGVALKLGDLLRAALNERIETYAARLDQGLTTLKASDEWLRLDERQREAILARPQLRNPPPPPLSSDRDLLNALRQRSLAEWDTTIAALPARLDDAHLHAVKLLQPAVVEVALDRPLMEKPIDVNRWLAKTRDALLAHVNAGHPVRIK